MRARVLGLALMLLAPVVVFADHYADLYVIPAAGHVTGIGGTSWMSDVAVQNFQSTPLTVEIVVIESGEGNPENVVPLQSATGSSVTIPAGGTRILRDLMNGHRGLTQSSGAILIGADRPFAVSSRFYAIRPNGPAQGQSIVPVSRFLENTLGDTNLDNASAYVPGLSVNAQYRTNLGFVAGSGSASGMAVEITLRNGAGTALGSRTLNIPGLGFTHVLFNTADITSQQFDEGSATYRIVSGDGAVVPFASVIDNASSAAFYVSGQFPDNAAIINGATFRMLLDRFRSAR
jgi:hypothetical protein